ncbi:MAG: hypothetical protein IJS21_00700, partial [Deltaproteobacteria bacterium]|nr:hypothetical protein [Deltaproteobacteria bacterium]
MFQIITWQRSAESRKPGLSKIRFLFPFSPYLSDTSDGNGKNDGIFRKKRKNEPLYSSDLCIRKTKTQTNMKKIALLLICTMLTLLGACVQAQTKGEIPTVTLNNGAVMPLFGIGTYNQT